MLIDSEYLYINIYKNLITLILYYLYLNYIDDL